MDSARHTEKLVGPNQDSRPFVCPEVLRTSPGAGAPAFVALCAPLRQTQRLSGLRLYKVDSIQTRPKSAKSF